MRFELDERHAIAGEFETLPDARAAGEQSDAILLSARRAPTRDATSSRTASAAANARSHLSSTCAAASSNASSIPAFAASGQAWCECPVRRTRPGFVNAE